jgi:hypothetical protein
VSEFMCASSRQRERTDISESSFPHFSPQGYRKRPLFNIEYTRVFPDSLHLWLRITDVLIRFAIREVIGEEGSDKFLVSKWVGACKDAGVKFEFWEKEKTAENESEKETGLKWTSLDGKTRSLPFPPSLPPPLSPSFLNYIKTVNTIPFFYVLNTLAYLSFIFFQAQTFSKHKA